LGNVKNRYMKRLIAATAKKKQLLPAKLNIAAKIRQSANEE